jgi:hypothetical protein
MTPEDYEQKRQARIARLEARAERLRTAGEASMKAGDQALSIIPFGQPILVGHHSERRDRNYRRRAFAKLDKGRALLSEAEVLERRAKAADENRAIFSDDPAASEKLEARITQLEARQARIVAANKLVRKQDRPGLLDLGFTEAQVEKLFTPDFCGRLGFPNYLLTNNGANIRRLKERLVTTAASQDRVTTETQHGDIRIVENTEDNRLQIFFPGKPDETTRTRLKSRGFRWSPTIGCWQRHLSLGARVDAEWAIQILAP